MVAAVVSAFAVVSAGAPAPSSGASSGSAGRAGDGSGQAGGSAHAPASTEDMMALLGMQTIRYQPAPGDVANPERGWYDEPPPGEWSTASAHGYTLAMRYVRLDRYAHARLPGDFLDRLDGELQSARGAGVKLIVRFAYNRSAGPDAPLDIVLEHIAQLAPILRRDADVIAVVQAGFIGQWGEWHNSSNGLLTRAHRAEVLDALLGAVPASRNVVVRAPYWVSDLYPNGVTAETAYTGTAVSRLGQHDDCFLAGTGRVASNGDSERGYIRQVTTFTAMGGETCSVGGLNANNGCDAALKELAAYHFDYLNADYDTHVIDRWKRQGCYRQISERLGYRYVLRSLTTPGSVRPGQVLGMSLRLVNQGFGKLYNPRPMQLVLVPDGGGRPTELTIAEDARKVLPDPGAIAEVPVDEALPAGTPSGRYHLYLRLPDASPDLASDPAYSVRLANAGTWVAGSGLNDLRAELEVERP